MWPTLRKILRKSARRLSLEAKGGRMLKKKKELREYQRMRVMRKEMIKNESKESCGEVL